MFAIRWSDVGYAEERGEQEIGGLTLVVEWEHIAQWKADPDGTWKIEKVASSLAGPGRRWTLTRWHPSEEKV